MKTKSQKHNWIVDAILFIGFVFAFLLDLTGLTWHQWLGVFVGVLSGYHIFVHWKWIKSVTLRFFKHTSNQARVYYLLDFILFAGFVLILESGLVISSWLNLELEKISILVDLHIWASILTLILIVIKIGLHWRWIVNTAKRSFIPSPKPSRPTWRTPQPAGANRQISRREFLSLMGIVGAASFVAVSSALGSKKNALAGETEFEENVITDDLDTGVSVTQDKRTKNADVDVSISPNPTTEALDPGESLTQEATLESANATVSVTQEPTAENMYLVIPTIEDTKSVDPNSNTSSSSCTVRCNRGCTYPGRCRKYVDSNQNNICDLTECA